MIYSQQSQWFTTCVKTDNLSLTVCPGGCNIVMFYKINKNTTLMELFPHTLYKIEENSFQKGKESVQVHFEDV